MCFFVIIVYLYIAGFFTKGVFVVLDFFLDLVVFDRHFFRVCADFFVVCRCSLVAKALPAAVYGDLQVRVCVFIKIELFESAENITFVCLSLSFILS